MSQAGFDTVLSHPPSAADVAARAIILRPAFGKPYREITDQEWGQVRSISLERHRGLNWLCGYAPENRWEKTPTGT